MFPGPYEQYSKAGKRRKMIVAGPLGKNDKTYRGIFILDVKTLDEAKVLLQADPAVTEVCLRLNIFMVRIRSLT